MAWIQALTFPFIKLTLSKISLKKNFPPQEMVEDIFILRVVKINVHWHIIIAQSVLSVISISLSYLMLLSLRGILTFC